jgi:hypothetical protein
MSGKLQLYMPGDRRAHFQQRHGFYCEQVKTRIFSQFENIGAEADAHMEKEYDRLGSICSPDEDGACAAAEMAESSAGSLYSLLLDLKKQTILGALAGMYHQWEKDLRHFIERELSHDIEHAEARKIAWKSKVDDVFEILTDFGWNCRKQSFFSRIEACRLVVNVYKHGKGPSLDRLADSFPEYLEGLDKDDIFYSKEFLDYEWLSVTAEQFNDMAEAISSFWKDFPGRLFYTLPENI